LTVKAMMTVAAVKLWC